MGWYNNSIIPKLWTQHQTLICLIYREVVEDPLSQKHMYSFFLENTHDSIIDHIVGNIIYYLFIKYIGIALCH